MFFAISGAKAETRTLYLYYTHTKETKKITFKRNGRYVKKGLDELSYMLRDWRRNEVTKMDPALFDLVWEVYQESGASGPIHVVSAYRSPKTNEMLRSRSRAVAKGSRHTKGQALDFFIPGVPTRKLREIAMKKQIGGVGYYPASNSPFVHLDTGSVRAWPRMTKTQLARLFPDGKTLHLPNTGVPLSREGYKLAQAEWNKCRRVPCKGSRTIFSSTRVASNSKSQEKPKRTLFDLFFGGDEQEGQNNNVNIANNSTNKRQVTTTSVKPPIRPKKAPIPKDRPKNNIILSAKAPTPANRPETRRQGNIVVAAIDEIAAPAPRILFSDKRNNSPSLITAYAPENNISIGELIASQENNEQNDKIKTASTPANESGDKINDLIDNSWKAVAKVQAPPEQLSYLNNLKLRPRELVAPDLYHVAQIFIDPRAISSARYAIIFEPDEADFSPEVEAGPYSAKLVFSKKHNIGEMNMFRFKKNTKLIVALR